MMEIGNPYIQYMYSYPHKTAYGPLEGVFLEDYVGKMAGKGHGLYLHIPFCQGKCGYCNLFSVTGQSNEAMDQYLNGVERQSRQYGTLLVPYETEFSEFTIGGGTPLLLTERQLEWMFQIAEDNFVLQKGREIGIETAPNQTEKRKLMILKEAGVTRVSMGVQSFLDGELKILRRSHKADRARKALELLRHVDFPCINVDFIYGIPGQTVDSLLYSLHEALTFQPDELFLYPLYVKHGAGLIQDGVIPDWQLASRQYREASQFLKASGFRQDSMRRFVRVFGEDRKKSREFSECGFGTSLALGCGGRSYMGNLHFCTPYAITQEGCLEQLRSFENTIDFSRITHGIFLSREEMKRRYVIRHLLIRPGIGLKQYEKYFGTSVYEDFPVLEKWKNEGILQVGQKSGAERLDNKGWEKGEEIIDHTKQDKEEEFLTLTDMGMGLSDYLGPVLVSDPVFAKMKEWEKIYESVDGVVSGKSEKL